jgi:hypothetical protein
MDLPRAEIRYRGMRAVGAALIRRWHLLGTWLRPRAAPLAITALATMCMLVALDLIAHDFRKVHASAPRPRPMVIYLMSMQEAPANVIPVELLASPPVDETCAPNAGPIRLPD